MINAKVRLAELSEKERQAVRKRADELYAEVTSAVSGKFCRPKGPRRSPRKSLHVVARSLEVNRSDLQSHARELRLKERSSSFGPPVESGAKQHRASMFSRTASRDAVGDANVGSTPDRFGNWHKLQ